MIRVAIVAPSPLVRSDLRRVVAGETGFEPRCESATMASLHAALIREPDLFVDVAIVDHRPAPVLPDAEGEALLEALQANLRVVLVSDAEAARVLPFVAAGAAWLDGSAGPEHIAAAVRAAHAGLLALQPGRFDELRADVRRRAAGERAALERIEPLTARERQVLERLAAGHGNRHIAGDLGISEHTAKFHVSRILGKLAAATRAEAVAIGLREGLIDEA